MPLITSAVSWEASVPCPAQIIKAKGCAGREMSTMYTGPTLDVSWLFVEKSSLVITKGLRTFYYTVL
jgi:hypothetical protein